MENESGAKIRRLGRASGPTEERLLWERFRDAADVPQFRASWLALQAQAIPGARAAVLVGPSDGEPAQPLAVWPAGEHREHLVVAAARALGEGRPVSLEGSDAEGKESTLGVAALPIEGAGMAVAVEVSPGSRELLERAQRALRWGAAWPELLATREASERGREILELQARCVEETSLLRAATALAGELAARLACSRVAIGLVVGQGVVLQAISGTSQFDVRTEAARRLEAAMDEAVDQGVSLRFSESDPEDAAPPYSVRAQLALAAHSRARAVLTVPFLAADGALGAILLERHQGAAFSDDTQTLVEVVAGLVGPGFSQRQLAERPLHQAVAERAKRLAADLFSPGRVAPKLGLLLAIVLVGALILVPATYRVTAEARLEARVLRAAVAPFDGYVLRAAARAGDLVAEGDLLAELDDRDLRLETARWASETEQLEKQHRESLAEHDAGKARVLRAQIDQATAQAELAAGRLQKAVLRAPLAGVVVSGDLSQSLGAPVTRGDVLFEVAPLDSYRLVVSVSERDIDDVSIGQTGQLAFAALPEARVPFEVVGLPPISEAREGVNTFRVEAQLLEHPAYLRPGLEGIAKIEAGQRSWLWIWTHDAFDTVRMLFWRWWP